MYTITLLNDRRLYGAHKEAIMQYDNMVGKIQFLIPQTYDGNDMRNFTTVSLEYISPISHLYKQEFLTLSEELVEYADEQYLEYLLPIGSKMTAEDGDIELQLSFYQVYMDEDGVVQDPVMKTQSCKVKIIPTKNWAQFVPSESMAALDQRIAQLIALEEEITELQGQIIEHHDNFINDDVISDKTTYSSKKIEEFIDKNELDETVENITNTEKQTISDEEIENLFK